MVRPLLCLLALLTLPAPARAANPVVELTTTAGTIAVELYPDKAPKTVENFLAYVDSGFYDGTLFHRVVKGFVIQGGGFTKGMHPKETRPPIPNEADNGLRNERGTVAMARTYQPHSATSQFYINLVDNPALDHRDKSLRGWGYCVFGRVIEGMEVVDAIAKLPTGTRHGYRDVPLEDVVILKARRRSELPPPAAGDTPQAAPKAAPPSGAR